MTCFLFAVLAGITVVLQNSINGLLSSYLGIFEVAGIGFTVQLILLCAYQLIRRQQPVSLKKIPLPYFSAGILAVFIVGTIGICMTRMGSAVTTCCSVAGQIIMSAVTDHFGLFHTKKNRFSVRRIPGFLMILAGVLAMNLLGGNEEQSVSLGYLLLGMFLGVCAIVVRTLNFKATQASGSNMGGAFANSLGGAVSAIVLVLITTGFRPDLTVLTRIPVLYYTAGVMGTISLVSNIVAYKTQKIFYATIFMLFGQVVTGIVMDLLVFHLLSAGKLIGIAIVVAGVLLDKLMTRRK